jgi:hypothetical protein
MKRRGFGYGSRKWGVYFSWCEGGRAYIDVEIIPNMMKRTSCSHEHYRDIIHGPHVRVVNLSIYQFLHSLFFNKIKLAMEN